MWGKDAYRLVSSPSFRQQCLAIGTLLIPSAHTLPFSPHLFLKRIKKKAMNLTKDIILDTKQLLLDVYDGSTSTFIAHLLGIQNYAQSREKTKKKASRLRFLDISSTFRDRATYMQGRSNVSVSQAQGIASLPIRILDLTRREDITDHSYIAVLWRWKSVDEGKRPGSLFHYRIRKPRGILRSSDFPDSYFNRVINFARAEGIRYI